MRGEGVGMGMGTTSREGIPARASRTSRPSGAGIIVIAALLLLVLGLAGCALNAGAGQSDARGDHPRLRHTWRACDADAPHIDRGGLAEWAGRRWRRE